MHTCMRRRGALLLLLAAAAVGAAAQQCQAGPPCAFKVKGALCPDAQLVDAKEPMRQLLSRVVAVAEAQARETLAALKVGDFPYASDGSGGWTITSTPSNWTGGFFTGVLWNLYNLTGKPEWRAHAERWQQPLANLQRDWSLQHDFGFVYLPSFGEAYAATGSEQARRQVLAAAEATAWAFNEDANATRTFEGWDPPSATKGFRQVVIIDHMCNVPVLLAGAKLGGPRSWYDEGPQDWVNMAVAHARTVARHHIRPDGSTYHVVELHPTQGTVNKRYTYQGYADDSTWARGQAWAMAGFATLYKETKLPEFLEAAQAVTSRWLSLLMTQQGPGRGGWVPLWDFNAPYVVQENGPMDSSAAAVAAYALLTLAEADPGSPAGRRALCAGANTLRALASGDYLTAPTKRGGALLLHATGHKPDGRAIDVGIVWGDYYFLEALEVCKRLPGCIGA